MARKRRFKRGVKTFGVSMPTEMYNELRGISEATGVPVSEVVRRAVSMYLEALRHGLSMKMTQNTQPTMTYWQGKTITEASPIRVTATNLTEVLNSLRELGSMIEEALRDGSVEPRLGEARQLAREIAKTVKTNDASLLIRLIRLISDGNLDSWARARELINDLINLFEANNE